MLKAKCHLRKNYKNILDPTHKYASMSARTRSRWNKLTKTTQEQVEERDRNQTIRALEESIIDSTHSDSCELQNFSENFSDSVSDVPENEHSEYRYDMIESADLFLDFEDYHDDEAFDHESDEEMDNTFSGELGHESNEFIEPYNTGPINGNSIMFQESNLTVSDVMLIVTTFSLKKKFTRKDQDDFIDLIKVFAGPKFDSWNPSHYIRSKIYDPPRDKIMLHYYCPNCCVVVTKKQIYNTKKLEVPCEKCHQSISISAQNHDYFISIDIDYQIKLLLNDRVIQDDLISNLNKISKDREKIILAKEKLKSKDGSDNEKTIRDIYDSEIYDHLQLKNPGTLTMNFNTDGAPIFKSSKQSFWPLQVYLNELSPKLRFSNLILVGIYLTDKEPKPEFMYMYMNMFYEQLYKLMGEGLSILNLRTKEYMHLQFCLAVGALDSVARPVVQNRFQFNAYYGCSWCYIYENYDTSMRYLMTTRDPDIRTNTSHCQDVEDVRGIGNKIKTIRGVKGSTIFIDKKLPFDNVWGFPVDYMHGILLGVSKQLWTKWTTHGTEYYLTPYKRQIITKRIMLMTPCHEIHRMPRPLSDMGKMKASEMRSWLLFYSSICLYGILETRRYNSYLLFVRSIFTLLSQNIDNDRLKRCEYDLTKFVGECQIFYGDSFMTFNVHSLLHLVQSVKSSGPLWSTSTFSFENGIFYFKQEVQAPHGVGHQIAKNWLKKSELKSRIEVSAISSTCKTYCMNLMSNETKLKNATKIDSEITLLGGSKEHVSIESQLREALSLDRSMHIIFYDRCIFRGVLLHSIHYNLPIRTNDTIVELITGEIVQIHHFVILNTKCYIYGFSFYNENSSFGSDVIMDHLREITSENVQPIFFEVRKVKQKLLHLNIGSARYVAVMPNTVEIQ